MATKYSIIDELRTGGWKHSENHLIRTGTSKLLPRKESQQTSSSHISLNAADVCFMRRRLRVKVFQRALYLYHILYKTLTCFPFRQIIRLDDRALGSKVTCIAGSDERRR